MNEVRALSRLSFEELAWRPAGSAACTGHRRARVPPASARGPPVGSSTTRPRAAPTAGSRRRGAARPRRRPRLARRGPARAPALDHAPRERGARRRQRADRRPARARGLDLHEPLAVRVDGRAVAPAEALAAAFPDATPRLVVFLHGLMGTEHSWRSAGAARRPTATRLAADLGTTPVDVRYNTGRHVSDNGRSLADLLEALVAAWPVEVDESRSSGHSMGGLVARSACHQAAERGARLGRPRAPRRLARHAAHGRAARAGRARRERRPARAARDAAVRQLPAPAQRGASATCATARSSTRTGATAIPTRCAPRPARRCRCSTARRTASSRRRSPAAPRHPLGRLIGDWLVLDAERVGPQPLAPDPVPRPSTACTSAAPTTSRCSTTPRSTSGCATG